MLGAEHLRFECRPRLNSSVEGSWLSTVVQFALSPLTDFCQQSERAFAEEDFKLDLSGELKEKKEDFDVDFSMIVHIHFYWYQSALKLLLFV